MTGGALDRTDRPRMRLLEGRGAGMVGRRVAGTQPRVARRHDEQGKEAGAMSGPLPQRGTQ
jgi:hypothetical protein